MRESLDEVPHPGRWIAMGVLLVAGFMNLIDVTIVNVALPSMQRAFGATDSQIEWVVAAYILTFALGLMPFGRLGDVVGRRQMFLAGICVFTLGSALCGLAPGMRTLIAARVLQGVGGAMMIPQTLAITPALFPPHERGFAFSLFGLTAGLASVAGPVIGGLLIRADIVGLGWRPIFLVNIPIGIAAVFATLRFVPSPKGERSLGSDLVGIAIAAVTLLLLIVPLIEGRQLGWPLWAFGMIAASLAGAAAFVAWERRQARRVAPEVLPAALLESRNYLTGAAMVATLFSGIPGLFMVLALYLQNGYGLDALHSGLATLPFPVGVFCASLVSGRLGTRWPRRRITTGALLLAGGMLALRVVVLGTGEEISRVALAPALFVAGLGLGVSVAMMFQTVLASVPPRDTGSASGSLQAFQQVGGAFGVAIMGELFFGSLAGGLAGAGDPHAAYAAAMSRALIYSILAFVAVAVMAQTLPRPNFAGFARRAPVVAPLE